MEDWELDDIISNSIFCMDEGGIIHRTYKEEVRVKRSTYDPLYWLGNKWTIVEKEVTISEWEPKYVDYVNMHEVANNYFRPLYKDIINAKYNIIEAIVREIVQIKHTSKGLIMKVEKILAKKLRTLREYAKYVEYNQKGNKQKEYELGWMNDITDRVNNLINY